MIPVSLRHFKTTNTNLYLNGPLLKIVDQPSSITTSIGSTVVISGFATATFDQNPTAVLDGNITYQWYGEGGTALVDGDKFVGTATSQLTISNPQSVDTGDNFYYEAGYKPGPKTNNSLSSDLKSDNSTLTVLPAITITEQPVDGETSIGIVVTFSGDASISAGYDISDVSYYWTVDGEVQPNSDTKVFSVTGINIGTQEVRFNATTTITSVNDGQTVTNTITATSDPVNLVTVDPRSIVRFEAINSVSGKYAFKDVNFDEVDEFTLNSNIFGNEYDIITYYALDKDLDLTMDIEAPAGGSPSPPPRLMAQALTQNAHGEGGVSKVKLLHTKNVEHTILGTTDNNAVFMYRGSNLLCVCAQGGADGTINQGGAGGGAGGGVNVGGAAGSSGRRRDLFNNRRGAQSGGPKTPRPEPGSLKLNGVFGSIISRVAGLQPGDSVATGNGGGRTISCTKGKYWIDKGISPCEDNSDVPIKFFTQDGVEIAKSNEIIRGFKPGYTITTTAGSATKTQSAFGGTIINGTRGGRGGNGAVGGAGGDGGGGAGGAGYTDGTVTILSTQLGGNTGIRSKVVFRLST